MDQRRKVLVKVPTLLYISLCLLGLLFQGYVISDVYFKYGVRSTVTVEMPQVIRFDAMTLCTRYIDVLDYGRMNQEMNASWRYSLDDEEIRSLQDSLSLGSIFDYTPAIDDVIKTGYYRTPGTYMIRECHNKNCSRSFNVIKFYYLEYICYKISLKRGTSMSFMSLTDTAVSPGLLIRIQFSSMIDHSLRIVIMTHNPSLLPYRSLMITPVILRGSTQERLDGKRARFSRFTSYQRRMNILNLPPPYETRCFDYSKIGLHSDMQCMQECIMNQTIGKIMRLPFSVLLQQQQSNHLHVLSYRDTLNQRLMQRVHDIEQDCNSSCRWLPCVAQIAITVTSMITYPAFESEVTTPIKPSFTIKFYPMINLTEYIIYLMSICTTWTGLHMMQMNPFQRMIRRGWFMRCKNRTSSQIALRRISDQQTATTLSLLGMRLDWMEKTMQRERMTQGRTR